MPELHVIYCRHTGEFRLIEQAFEQLFKWAEPRGVVKPTTKVTVVYLDDPEITSIDKVRQDACIIIEDDAKGEGDIGKSIIPAGKYAVGCFEIKDTQFEEARNTMHSWLTENGYQPGDGMTYELYYNQHNNDPDFKFILDICINIKLL